MLPIYIIEELERDKRQEPEEQVYIEHPDLDDPLNSPPTQPNRGKQDKPERGVVIIDYTI